METLKNHPQVGDNVSSYQKPKAYESVKSDKKVRNLSTTSRKPTHSSRRKNTEASARTVSKTALTTFLIATGIATSLIGAGYLVFIYTEKKKNRFPWINRFF